MMRLLEILSCPKSRSMRRHCLRSGRCRPTTARWSPFGHHLEVFTAVSWTFWAAMLSDAMVSTAPGANSITAVLLLRTDNHQGPSGAFSYWCSMAGHRAASRVSCAHAD
ncbi:Putative uncharacterized protein [Mycobacterium tuberculosis variant bovis]|uniref:Uncharacterized protein n=3 Tax=Mycobacterium tuberculosis TaxID=1773 RepID=Q8VJM4_MYCTO|nr:hypothetical protein MT2367.1 [Mycobacterium tuberculosis CDC1551]AKR02098.1 hypothetical protein Mb1595_p2575 [Mycobacterium tuberculosis variant bovis]EFD13982.1 conserved hypothetical protein [Mycobacterium tuberculosis T46]EFD18105.1 conserved hypothetical protein [Mycobacterium tuberculosis CPHL_A]EFD44006.1 conserved hypothetical protein [Mycobacterium tuberculosis variant africanum K85]EFD47835.1 conserved hypothetical protein [Mycobacterium tuberculosis T17]EFP19149.1 hypothetical 